MKTCSTCGQPYEKTCKPCRAAYMREWSRRHRVRLKATERAKKLALMAAGVERIEPCRRCGRPLRLTPALIVHRIRTCSVCLSHGRKTEYHRNYAQRNPLTVAAQYEARKAIMRGDLVPRPCEQCGAEKTQGHHDDYSKPLEVRWLCVNCHRLEHLRRKGMIA